MSTIIATSAAPRIVCPPWCVVDQEQHVAELPNLEGFVVHHSAEVKLSEGNSVAHSAFAYIDGTLDPTEPPLIFVVTPSDGIPVDHAEELAHAILAAVAEARA